MSAKVVAAIAKREAARKPPKQKKAEGGEK